MAKTWLLLWWICLWRLGTAFFDFPWSHCPQTFQQQQDGESACTSPYILWYNNLDPGLPSSSSCETARLVRGFLTPLFPYICYGVYKKRPNEQRLAFFLMLLMVGLMSPYVLMWITTSPNPLLVLLLHSTDWLVIPLTLGHYSKPYWRSPVRMAAITT